MASVILSGTPAELAGSGALPNPIVAQGAGGGQVVAQWDGTAFGSGRFVSQVGGGNLQFVPAIEIDGGAAVQQNRWAIGTGAVEAGGNSGNNLVINAYDDNGAPLGSALEVIRADQTTLIQPGFASIQCGIAPLATGDQTADVANTAVTANSVIICSMMGAEDSANVTVDGVVITPGVGFQIQLRGIVASNPSTSSVAWFIAKF